jgi:hypothetical protein
VAAGKTAPPVTATRIFAEHLRGPSYFVEQGKAFTIAEENNILVVRWLSAGLS